MAAEQTFLIVGASLAGATAAETLRKEGFTGRVVLIGEEDERPYQRPPLSKGYLLGDEDESALYAHEAGWYADNGVELLSGRRVVRVDRDSRVVHLDDGAHFGYTRLLLTNGATPRRLDVPGANLDGVHYLRRAGDSRRLRQALADGGDVAVVGAGWIGLETAAAARSYGCRVTIVEPQPAPLRAALGEEMGGWFADLHRRHEVDVRLGRAVTEIEGKDGRVIGVVTDDGSRVDADVVIVGIGVVPNTALAEDAGLSCDDGVMADESLRTSDPEIFAAGDVANAHHPLFQRRIRVEHWSNAIDQAKAAARAMLGQPVSDERLPYFFTDQYDVGMEFCGWFPPGEYDTVVTRGDVAGAAFYAFWVAAERVVAGMHINCWDDGIDPVRELIRAGRPASADRLADESEPLTDLAAG